MISTSLVAISVFSIGLILRYTDWSWPIWLWFVITVYVLGRKVFTYWRPWLFQKVCNGWKRVWRRLYKGCKYELDGSNKKPFECSNCRKSKHWYEELPGKWQTSLDQKICTTCGDRSAAVRVLTVWHPPEPEGDIYLPPGAAEAFRERERKKKSHGKTFSDFDDPGD